MSGGVILGIGSIGGEHCYCCLIIAFQSYKSNGKINQIIEDIYGKLQQGLKKKLTFSLGGGKMVKNINKKIKNTKKYKRVNKKYHSKYKNNNMTNKKCHTHRKNRRIKHFIINF